MKNKNYITSQEDFWAGEFGANYICRNDSSEMVASQLNTFSKALKMCGSLKSALEIGANIGLNLKALQLLYPSISLKAVEINLEAAKRLMDLIGAKNVFHGSIFECSWNEKVDLTISKGVLIHINPDMLQSAYEFLYQTSQKYILLSEYYNPTPIGVDYKGHKGKLYKRDFAGEMLDRYPDLKLINYGFVYHRDPTFPDDDTNWFLLEKT